MLVVMLLVLWSYVAMSLGAVMMTLHDEMAPAPIAAAVPSFQFDTEAADPSGMPCCIPAMVPLCPQLCVAGQVDVPASLQTPAVTPLPIFLANIFLHADAIRTPTPPPRA